MCADGNCLMSASPTETASGQCKARFAAGTEVKIRMASGREVVQEIVQDEVEEGTFIVRVLHLGPVDMYDVRVAYKCLMKIIYLIWTTEFGNSGKICVAK